MVWRARTHVLLFALALLVALKLGDQMYRWLAFTEEREQLRTLNAELETAGVTAMRTQLRADSLRDVIQALDRELERERAGLSTLQARHGVLTASDFAAYRARLAGHNHRIDLRNARYQRWKEVVDKNHRAVRRYNALADAIRSLAARMGDPYYAVPTPAELGVRYGLAPPPLSSALTRP